MQNLSVRNRVAPDIVQTAIPLGPNLVLSGNICLACVYNGMRDNSSKPKIIGKYGSNQSKVVLVLCGIIERNIIS